MDGAREQTVGRREANHRATREAILAAARRLFAEHGYEETTVRSVADAAGTTERTFYRYFEGKEGLLADDVADWITRLHDAIVQRPGHETPIAAVRGAMIELNRRIAVGEGPAPVWMFTDQPRPLRVLRHSAPRPLLRFEQSIADAILARRRGDRPGGDGNGDETRDATPEELLDAELTARVCVAVLRTVTIHRRRVDPDRATHGPPTEDLLNAAFERVASQLHLTR